ncbi:MAG TPA: secondary thiamine-phosphate synthase enzyme YjbQ [Acidobacteriota bacterium]|nr:secondary thiamine-phosphate synthase enzyme YjbQ [Acidobacteriota bacterium]
MQKSVWISTNQHNALYDITGQVREIVQESRAQSGIVNVYVRHATAAIMIQENWDESVQTDVVNLLKKMIPAGVWMHDKQDGNGDAHLKAGLIGPSQTIPIVNGEMALGRWQNIFLCEFDGPRKDREIVITVVSG